MNDSNPVLYDAPGPRAKLLTVIVSVVAAALIILGGYYLIYLPLDAKGQFSGELWGPFVDPDNQYFTQLWTRIWDGFRATLEAAAFSIVASLLVGTGLAVLRVQLKSLLRRRFAGLAKPVAIVLRALAITLNAVTRFVIEIFRGIPVVITIFFVSVWLPTIGAETPKPGQAAARAPLAFDDPLWYLVIGLAIYNSVVIGEVLRSGMDGLPGGQREAAQAIGLSSFQTTRLVLLPQAFRIMLPALISQLVVVLKDTSLGFIISYEEILRVSTQVVQFLNNPIQVYFVVGVIFIIVNYLLSRLARYAQHRLARGRRGSKVKAPVLADVAADASLGFGPGGSR